MATARIKVDYKGIGVVLKSGGVREVIDGLADQVSSNVASQHLTADSASSESGVDVVGVVESYTTDRAAAAVTIKHPDGLAMQARHGVLTKAAAAAGLEVHQ